MMATPLGICVICKYRIEKNICSAFKGNIPKEILSGEVDHTKPYKGDNGIQFKPIKEKK